MVDLAEIRALYADAEAERQRELDENDRQRLNIQKRYETSISSIKNVEEMLRRKAALSNAGSAVSDTAGVSSPTPTPPPTLETPVGSADHESIPSWPGFRQAIRESIKDATEFTLDDVMNYLDSRYSDRKIQRVAVSGELYGFRKGGEITLVRKGKGSSPNIYRKEVIQNGHAIGE